LGEVEEACARAIIVSKGRVVADGPLDDIRAKTGSVRYVVTVDEKRAEAGNRAPTSAELRDALERLDGARGVRELPTDETAHRFELSGSSDSDLRAEIFRLMVAKGWTLLELRRDAQSLDAVFRDLTRGDERLDRGYAAEDAEAAGAEEEADEQDEEDDDEDDEESDEDEDDEDEDEEEDRAEADDAKSVRKG
jgi:ABC-2 type transport system ATP-binding protein